MKSYIQWLVEEKSVEDYYKMAGNTRLGNKGLNDIISHTNDEEVYLNLLHKQPAKLTREMPESEQEDSHVGLEHEYKSSYLHKMLKNTDSTEVLHGAFETFKNHPDENFRSGMFRHIVNHPSIKYDDHLYDSVLNHAHQDHDVMNNDHNYGFNDIFGYKKSGNSDISTADMKEQNRMTDMIKNNHNIHRHIVKNGDDIEKVMVAEVNKHPSHSLVKEALKNTQDSWVADNLSHFWGHRFDEHAIRDYIPKSIDIQQNVVDSPHFNNTHVDMILNKLSTNHLYNDKLMSRLINSHNFKHQMNGINHIDVINKIKNHGIAKDYEYKLHLNGVKYSPETQKHITPEPKDLW